MFRVFKVRVRVRVFRVFRVFRVRHVSHADTFIGELLTDDALWNCCVRACVPSTAVPSSSQSSGHLAT